MESQELVGVLTTAEAMAFAQFLKRASVEDYQLIADSEEEAWLMLSAGQRIREFFDKAGVYPL